MDRSAPLTYAGLKSHRWIAMCRQTLCAASAEKASLLVKASCHSCYGDMNKWLNQFLRLYSRAGSPQGLSQSSSSYQQATATVSRPCLDHPMLFCLYLLHLFYKLLRAMTKQNFLQMKNRQPELKAIKAKIALELKRKWTLSGLLLITVTRWSLGDLAPFSTVTLSVTSNGFRISFCLKSPC